MLNKPLHSPHLRYALTALLAGLIIALTLIVSSFYIFRMMTSGL